MKSTEIEMPLNQNQTTKIRVMKYSHESRFIIIPIESVNIKTQVSEWSLITEKQV